MMGTYHANVQRGDKYWVIYVPEVDRWTQARHLREVDAVARDLVAIMDEVPADSFDLEQHIDLPSDVQDELAVSASLREQAARNQADAARLVRHAAAKLYEQGLPYRDVGQVLGVSFQRAKQLVDEVQDIEDGRSVLAATGGS